MSPSMPENMKLPTTTSSELSTSAPPNQHPPRRSRPRVREVSSRFMSPSINSTPKPIPSTPSDSHASKLNSVRRSQTDLRPRYADENRSDALNRSSVSPVRSGRPRSAVKLFKETPRHDTPVPALAPAQSRFLRHRNWDTAAAKLLQANGISANNDNNGGGNRDESNEEVRSMDGDCESVKSEPCDGGFRVLTPCSRSMEMRMGGGGGNEEKGASRMGKVGRSLNLPPMPPGGGGGGKGVVEGKKVAVTAKKGMSQQEEGQRLRMMYNHYLQWRFANAKAEASMISHKKQCERQLYALGMKISELQDSVKAKRTEYTLLKETKLLSIILDTQMPYLDEWSTLEESYSSSLGELTQGLLNVLSQLPLVGNVRADVKEIEEAIHGALKVAEMICLQVQSFMPKAEHTGGLISDLARVCSGEISLVEECGDLLSKTHLSQVEECSLRGQVMQFQRCNLNSLKEQF